MPGISVTQSMENSDIAFSQRLKHICMQAKCLLNTDAIEYEYYVISFLSQTLCTWSRSYYFKNKCYNLKHKATLKQCVFIGYVFDIFAFTPENFNLTTCRRFCMIRWQSMTLNAQWMMCLSCFLKSSTCVLNIKTWLKETILADKWLMNRYIK